MGLIALILIIPPWLLTGRFIVRNLAPDLEPSLRDSSGLALGLAILSYVVMLMGALGWLDSVIFWLFILGCCIPLTWSQIKTIGDGFKTSICEIKTTRDQVLVGLIGLLFLFDLINAGNAAVGWDAAVHHYAFPKILLKHGYLINTPEIPFSFYPSLGEMLFTLGLSVGGVFLAGALSWIYLFPLAASFMSLGKKLGSPCLGLWALLIFLGMPLTFEMPFSGVIDIIFITYCALAIAVLFCSDSPLRFGRIILLSLLIGCSAATKHLGLLFLIAIIPAIIWKLINDHKRLISIIGPLVIVTLVCLIVPLPWYLRSFFATGNPLFPFLSNLLDISSEITGSFSLASFARTEYPRNLLGYAGFLWHLTMHYWDERPWFWAINPAFLAFLPFGIIWAILPLKKTTTKENIWIARNILILALISLTINFFLAPAYPRYLLVTWFCLSIVSAWVIHNITSLWEKPVIIFALAFLIFPFLIVLFMAGKRASEVIPQFFSEKARISAIEKTFAGYPTFAWSNNNLDHSKSVIVTIDPKIYYLNSPAIIAKAGIESPLLLPWDSAPSEILENFRSLNVTHFILDTTLISVKHGFGIAFFTDVLGDRDKVWLDINSTRAGANVYGIGDILSDEEFLQMSKLAGLKVVNDGVIDRHLFTRAQAELFQSWGRDWLMARFVLLMINSGILKEEFRSGPGGGLRIYSLHLPPKNTYSFIGLADVTSYCLEYDKGPTAEL